MEVMGKNCSRSQRSSSRSQPAASFCHFHASSKAPKLEKAPPEQGELWGWWLTASAAAAAAGSGDQIAEAWAVAPVLQLAVLACMAMSVMLVLEVAYMSLINLVIIKLLRRVPERRYKWEPICVGSGDGVDEEEETAVGRREAVTFPMVLVQIPLFSRAKCAGRNF